jgi:transaldolase
MSNPSLLDQLKTMTIVVADTGDLNSVQRYSPRDATTNPSLIAAAAKMPEHQEVVQAALRAARSESTGAREALLRRAVDRLAVEFGLRMLQLIPGRVSTEVDARLSFDTAATVAKARELVALYRAAGVGPERILIKIASTWEGIQAAAQLEREGTHCNLTLLFGLHQAVACAEAGATLISPFVGRILDWYLKDTGRAAYPPAEDPGVMSVARVYRYYKQFGYRTEVMGASFRNVGEILELAGCDLLTISPKLLGELQAATGTLVRKLDPAARDPQLERLPMDEAAFRRLHGADRMSTEKLAEGIESFAQAQAGVEAMLGERL